MLLLMLPAALATDWWPVAPGVYGSVSGLAVELPGVMLAAHDNKETGRTRLSRVQVGTGNVSVTALSWSGAEPKDLEALAAVPGEAGRFVALASAGEAILLRVEGPNAIVERTFGLPGAGGGSNIEGFALAQVGGSLLAVWAERGGADGRTELVAAGFDPSGGFGAVSRAALVVPGRPNLRVVSDLGVDESGAILAAWAVDPGDLGPFSSGVYLAGSVSPTDSAPSLRATPSPVDLVVEGTHKIEALALVPGGGLWLGSDDELYGGWIGTP